MNKKAIIITIIVLIILGAIAFVFLYPWNKNSAPVQTQQDIMNSLSAASSSPALTSTTLTKAESDAITALTASSTHATPSAATTSEAEQSIIDSLSAK